MTKDQTLDRAIQLALEFAHKAKQVRDERKEYRLTGGGYCPASTKTHASMKRASMELTRVLADLRQGR